MRPNLCKARLLAGVPEQVLPERPECGHAGPAQPVAQGHAASDRREDARDARGRPGGVQTQGAQR